MPPTCRDRAALATRAAARAAEGPGPIRPARPRPARHRLPAEPSLPPGQPWPCLPSHQPASASASRAARPPGHPAASQTVAGAPCAAAWRHNATRGQSALGCRNGITVSPPPAQRRSAAGEMRRECSLRPLRPRRGAAMRPLPHGAVQAHSGAGRRLRFACLQPHGQGPIRRARVPEPFPHPNRGTRERRPSAEHRAARVTVPVAGSAAVRPVAGGGKRNGLEGHNEIAFGPRPSEDAGRGRRGGSFVH